MQQGKGVSNAVAKVARIDAAFLTTLQFSIVKLAKVVPFQEGLVPGVVSRAAMITILVVGCGLQQRQGQSCQDGKKLGIEIY